MDITFTIPDGKFQRVKDAILYLYPNDERDGNGDLIYTDNQWLKEIMRRFVTKTVKRSEERQGQINLKGNLEEADSVIS